MNDEQQIIEPVPTMAGYKKIPTFKLWIANQFPYIETDFDAITNYDLLQAVIKYLNTIIENENNVESNVTALYNAFVNLHDYVEEQFDSLNLQDEVNTKIDEMYESGLFDNLLNNYLNLTKVFDTYIDMMLDTSTYVNGMKLKTLGYHTINDGGGAEYFVTNVQNDNKYQVSIGTNLWIELIIKNNTINTKQLGIIGNGENDNYNDFINLAQIINKNKIQKVLFSNEHYCLSNQVDFNISSDNIYIDFNNSIIEYISNTSFADRTSLIDIIFPISTNLTKSIIKNGNFTAPEILPSFATENVRPVGAGCMIRSNARIQKFENLNFNDVFFGYAIHSRYAKKLDILNCSGKNVGGRSATNDYDSAGDAIYISRIGILYNEFNEIDLENSFTGEINIQNCNFSSYQAVENQNTNQNIRNGCHSGRCGVVIGEYSETPQQKNININNCYFYNYQRSIHSEKNNNIILNVSNTVFEDYGSVILAGDTSVENISFSNCKFIKNINVIGIVNDYDYVFTGFTTNLVKQVNFNNCQFKGYAGKLAQLGKGIIFNYNNCVLEVEHLETRSRVVSNFNNCSIKANHNNFYLSIPSFKHCSIELGYKHDANSLYYLSTTSRTDFTEAPCVLEFSNNKCLNVGITPIATKLSIFINNNDFKFDSNFNHKLYNGSEVSYLMNLSDCGLRQFSNNYIVNDTSKSIILNNINHDNDEFIFANNIIFGGIQPFLRAPKYKIVMSNNHFDANGKENIGPGTELSNSRIIAFGNTYKGYTTAMLNYSNSLCYNNYIIEDESYTIIP